MSNRKNTDRFLQAFDAWQTKTGVAYDKALRQTALGVFRSVIQRTPVKTGRARGNWQATMQKPAQGTLARLDASGQIAIGEATQAVLGGQGDVFLLTNNLEYIQGLEYGRSGQAPQGMVRVTLEQFEQILRAAAQKETI